MQLEKREFSAKATGEALSAALAETVVGSSGDPLIELLTFFVSGARSALVNHRRPAKQFSPALQRWVIQRKGNQSEGT